MPNAHRGFWAGLVGKKCECSCSGADLQTLQEQHEEFLGSDQQTGRNNYGTKTESYAFCSRCRHKFRI